MKPTRWPAVAAAALFAALFVLAGCSGDHRQVAAPVAQTGPQVADLNDPNGGMAPTDEAPAFGDADLLNLATDEVEAATIPGNTEPSLFAPTNPPIANLYTMTITWGMLPGDSDGTGIGPDLKDGNLYDWSGGVRVNRGGISMRALISFERDDHLVVPRRDRRSVEWVSHTSAGMDGVRFVIMQPPFPDSVGAGDDTLHLRAGDFERTFLLSQLRDLDETVRVDDAGNAIRFQSAIVDPELNNHGFATGFWGARAAGDSVGIVGGILVSDYGRIAGYFHGYYGENDAGKPVLYAKVTGPAGAFRGFLRGDWSHAADNPGGTRRNGVFQATWFDENDVEVGALRGTWHLPQNGRGTLAGRWSLGAGLSGGGIL